MSGYQAGSVIYGLDTVIQLQRIALNVDMFIFGVWNRRECFFNQFSDRIFILFSFLIKYLESSVTDEPETISSSVHFAKLVIIPPSSNHWG